MFSVPPSTIPNFGGQPSMGGGIGALSGFPNMGLPGDIAGQPLTGMDQKGENTSFQTNDPVIFNLNYNILPEERSWTIGEAQLLFLQRDTSPDTKYQEFTTFTLSHLNSYLARHSDEFETGAEILERFIFFGLCEKPLAPGLNNGKGDYAERLRREHPGMSSGPGFLGARGSNRSTVIVDGPGLCINVWASPLVNATKDVADRKLSFLHLVLRKMSLKKGLATGYFDPYAPPPREKKRVKISHRITEHEDVDEDTQSTEDRVVGEEEETDDTPYEEVSLYDVNPPKWQMSPLVTHESPYVDPSIYTRFDKKPENCWTGGAIRVGMSHWIHPGTQGEEVGLSSFVHAESSPDYLAHLKTLPRCEVFIDQRRVLY